MVGGDLLEADVDGPRRLEDDEGTTLLGRHELLILPVVSPLFQKVCRGDKSGLVFGNDAPLAVDVWTLSMKWS